MSFCFETKTLYRIKFDIYLGHAHFKLLIRGVDNRGIWSAGADEADALRAATEIGRWHHPIASLRWLYKADNTHLYVCRQLHCPFCGHSVTGVEHSACWDGAKHGQILQGHLGRTILTWKQDGRRDGSGSGRGGLFTTIQPHIKDKHTYRWTRHSGSPPGWHWSGRWLPYGSGHRLWTRTRQKCWQTQQCDRGLRSQWQH